MVSHTVSSWQSPDFSLLSQTTNNSINPTWKYLLLPDRSLLTYCGFLPSLNLTGWPRFPERLGKPFVALSWTSGPATRAVCSEPVQRHVLSPSHGGRKGDPPFPRGWGRHQSHGFSPLLVPLQLAHSLPAGPRGAKHMNHIWHSSAAQQGNVQRY